MWSKRAKWSLVFAIAWAIFDGVRSYSSQPSAGYLPLRYPSIAGAGKLGADLWSLELRLVAVPSYHAQ